MGDGYWLCRNNAADVITNHSIVQYGIFFQDCWAMLVKLAINLDAELKIWISSELQPGIRKQFNKSVNVYEVQKVLAFYALNQGIQTRLRN